MTPHALSSVPRPYRNEAILNQLTRTRRTSIDLARPLSPEDMTVQASADASPTKWHLAHTTWFFETFVLLPHLPGYRLFNEAFNYCFNSYYEAIGPRQPRSHRGLLSRPSTSEVFRYRDHVDRALEGLLSREVDADVIDLIVLGINHEQQHQELLLTDILALFAAHPLRPAYLLTDTNSVEAVYAPIDWYSYPGGLIQAGSGGDGFFWDNETPRHTLYIEPFVIADRLVTCGEWLEFMEDGGYRTPSLWLSDGWTTVNAEGWRAPLYWEEGVTGWRQMSLYGLADVDPCAPVAHISYYEADAYARWAGKRLPTEFEWEVVATGAGGPSADVADLSQRLLRPLPVSTPSTGPSQLFSDVWQWTQSAYLSYPRYTPAKGAIGEYNGKFMVSQHVLRGASCVTPAGHSRPTYRNFFYPHQRWQFTGLRLAGDAE